MTYSYDPRGDDLYISFSNEKADRTVRLLDGWPMILVDVNEKDQVIGVEIVGVSQFGLA